jgi:hypothetical protein
MRLTLRFLALISMLVIVTLPNSSSITTLVEADNPCFEGCARGDQICRGECGLNASCLQKCDAERDKCHAKCKSEDLIEEPPQN